MHLPLVVASDGTRLAKRTGGASVRALRAAGITADAILGTLAYGLGLTNDDRPRSARAIADEARDRAIVWPRDVWRIPAAWAQI